MSQQCETRGGGDNPDPVRAAVLAQEAGADGITAHLREDRRHIIDADMEQLAKVLTVPLNFEMAATKEMQQIALRTKPHAVCLVPEKREERTTEGGLDVAGNDNALATYIEPLAAAGSRISMFIAADAAQLDASARIGAPVVELHAGAYADAWADEDWGKRDEEFRKIKEMATYGASLGLEIHVGHGLTYDNVGPIAALPEVRELNIGHFIIGEAIFRGLGPAIAEMRRCMDEARV